MSAATRTGIKKFVLFGAAVPDQVGGTPGPSWRVTCGEMSALIRQTTSNITMAPEWQFPAARLQGLLCDGTRTTREGIVRLTEPKLSAGLLALLTALLNPKARFWVNLTDHEAQFVEHNSCWAAVSAELLQLREQRQSNLQPPDRRPGLYRAARSDVLGLYLTNAP